MDLTARMKKAASEEREKMAEERVDAAKQREIAEECDRTKWRAVQRVGNEIIMPRMKALKEHIGLSGVIANIDDQHEPENLTYTAECLVAIGNATFTFRIKAVPHSESQVTLHAFLQHKKAVLPQRPLQNEKKFGTQGDEEIAAWVEDQLLEATKIWTRFTESH